MRNTPATSAGSRKKLLFPLGLLAVLALAGCASTPVAPLAQPAAGTEGEVIVFREYAFAAGGVGVTVGAGGSGFVVLANDQKVRARVPAGEYEIFAQARTAEPSKVRIQVAKGETVCLRTSANPNTFGKVLIPPVLMLTGYHFYLDRVPCPTEAELAKYKDVAVTYR